MKTVDELFERFAVRNCDSEYFWGIDAVKFPEALKEYRQEILDKIDAKIKDIEKLYKENKTSAYSADEKIEVLTELKKELNNE